MMQRCTYTEVVTAEWPYDPILNIAFGTISEVDVQVVFYKNLDGTFGYQAQFSLTDTYTFRGDNNILLSPLRLVGTEYTASGFFVVEEQWAGARPTRSNEPDDSNRPSDSNDPDKTRSRS